MPDRMTAALDALEQLDPDLRWDDIATRAEATADLILPSAPALDDRTDRRHPRRYALAGAAVVMILGLAAIAARDRSDEPTGMITSTAPTTPTTSLMPQPAPATTLPANGTAWAAAVTAWTGREYLVWSGQVGGDNRARADGWRYDPATGTSTDIPAAPVAPRDNAAGVWTGTELIVCCGRSLVPNDPAYSTADAAAYNPTSNSWRRLADPPTSQSNRALGAVWTGTAMLVVVETGDPTRPLAEHPLALWSYEPATDRWRTLAAPGSDARTGQVLWTGDTLVLWERGEANPDTGKRYNPQADSWTTLPPQPTAHRVISGSAVYLDGQILIWGLDTDDTTRAVGYRLNLGTTNWQRIATAPLAPIEFYEGTRGSQSLVADPARGRVIVSPITGSAQATRRAPTPLYAYSPRTDTWSIIAPDRFAGFAAPLTLAGDVVLQADRQAPVLERFGG